MKIRIIVLTILLAACTRSVSTAPVASPPVTVVASPESTVAGAATEPAPGATAGSTSVAVPNSNRLPAGVAAAEPIPAPQGGWAIWRRGTDAGQIFRADGSGQVVEIRLPAPEGARPSPEYVLSADGELIFYTLLDGAGGVIAQQFAAYEFATGRLQTLALDPEQYNLVDYGVIQGAFNPENTQVAFTLEGFPVDDSTQTSFVVYIWDLQANAANAAITPRTSVNPNLLPAEHAPLVVQWMPEGILLSGHQFQSTSYTQTLLWNLETDKIEAAADTSEGFAFRGTRLEGGSEMVWPDYDADYPAQPLDCWASQSPNNVLKVLDLEAEETRIIFAAGAGEQINRARWLDGGERLALLMMGCDRQASRLLVLNRQGAVSEVVPVAGGVGLFTSSSEIILLQEDSEANTTTITAYDGAQNWAAREVASFAGTLGASGYAFAFSPQAAAASGLEPFPEVGAESSLSGLEIGRRATVASSSGVLNIRTEPNPDSPALGLLAAGDEVTIVDGPVSAEGGLVYWQVQSDQGVVGWCVEAVDGEQTLIPKP